MSTTIFCIFEQQDLADLAVGKLRDSVLGIKSIYYVGGFNAASTPLNSSTTRDMSVIAGGIFGEMTMSSPPVPSRPATVKIVCADAAADAIKAKLINLHAHEIITSV